MIVYRTAEVNDIPELVQCRIQQLDDEEEHPQRDIREDLCVWFTRVLQNQTLYQIVAEDEGKIVATGGLLELDMPPGFFEYHGKTGYITNMYTVREYRHRGIASEILEQLKQEAVHRKMDRLILGASVWGEPVYRRSGFVPLKDWMEYALTDSEES